MGNVEELNRELAEKNLRGYWSVEKTDVEMEPAASFQPCLWHWSDVYGGLMKAGDTIGLDQAGRRFISFVAPPKRSYASNTLHFGAQLVQPGEIAEAHQHMMGAMRFVVRGRGAQTTVEGEPFPMEAGDFITTPSRTWHDHFNGSDEAIIWLDGGDAPLVNSLDVRTFRLFGEKQQPHSRPVDSSMYELGPARPNWISAHHQPPAYRYRWEDTARALEVLGERPGDPCEGILLRYVNPLTGGPTLPTYSCELQMLRPGEKTKSHRHTSTAIYHVFRGQGSTVVGDKRFEWETGDSFVVPLWHWHQHNNSGSEKAILFVINDRPTMEALGFYLEEKGD